MFWTTTMVPLWQIDCEELRREGLPFELRDVRTAEHVSFVENYAERFTLRVERTGATVTFYPGPESAAADLVFYRSPDGGPRPGRPGRSL